MSAGVAKNIYPLPSGYLRNSVVNDLACLDSDLLSKGRRRPWKKLEARNLSGSGPLEIYLGLFLGITSKDRALGWRQICGKTAADRLELMFFCSYPDHLYQSLFSAHHGRLINYRLPSSTFQPPS